MKYMANQTAISMRCANAKGLLSPYLDGAVTGTEMRALQMHLEDCTACLREYNSLRQTQQRLGLCLYF